MLLVKTLNSLQPFFFTDMYIHAHVYIILLYLLLLFVLDGEQLQVYHKLFFLPLQMGEPLLAGTHLL